MIKMKKFPSIKVKKLFSLIDLLLVNIINQLVQRIFYLQSCRDTWSDFFFKWLLLLLLWLNQIRYLTIMVLLDRVPNISLYRAHFFIFFQSGRIELWILMGYNLSLINTANAMILINLVPDIKPRLLILQSLLCSDHFSRFWLSR